MKITKFGHACLLVEEAGARILIDPGSWSGAVDTENIDAVLITHNHQDHLDPQLIRSILTKSPDAKVIAPAEAGKTLEEAGIGHADIADGEEIMLSGISIRSTGKQHAYIYGEVPQCQNTGYLVANRLYHPGDSFHIPEEAVEILALPVAGPWMKIAECIDFAKRVKPKVAIPIHDAFITPDAVPMMRRFPKMLLEQDGIEFRDVADGATTEL